MISFATRRRWTTLGVAAVIFVVTMCMGGLLKTNFFDQSGQNTLSISQKLPVGTSLATTDAAAKQVEAILAGTPEITTYQVTLGNGSGFAAIGSGGANTANYSVTLDESADAAAVQDRLRAKIEQLSGAGEIKVDQGGGGFNASELQVIVKANDEATLATAAEQVRAAMAGTPDVADVTTDLASSVPRIQVSLKRDAAARYGLSDAAVGQLVAAAFQGSRLGQYTIDGTPQTVLLTVGKAPASLDALRAYPLATPAGVVTLGQVADVAQVDGPVQITRIDGNRSVTVSGTATGDNTGKTSQDLTSRLKKLHLPPGCQLHPRRGQLRPGRRVQQPGTGPAGRHRDRLHHHGGDLPQPGAAVDPVDLGAVRGHRGDRVAADHRNSARGTRPDRHADVDRHCGDQRHRAARPDQPVPRAGHVGA